MKQSARIVVPLLVVLVVGLLGWLLWPSATTTPVGPESTAGPYLVRLATNEVAAGSTVLTFDITEGANSPASPDSVSVEPAMTQMGHAMSPVVATQNAPGTYQAQVDFSMVGQWEITVRIMSDNRMNDAVLPVTVVG